MAISNTSTSGVTSAVTPTRTNPKAMAMVTTLFFMWGFLTCLNDVVIPHLKLIFDLNYAEVMLVQFCFFTAYVVFAFPSGMLIEKIGYKRSMVVGLCTMGVGALLFLPAAMVPSFPFFLCALIVLAVGITCLQVSANPYVSVLGPEATASSRLNLTQAFNSFGTFLAPFLGAVILSSAPKGMDEIRAMAEPVRQAYRLTEASSVKMPYALIAGALFVLAIIIGRFNLPAISAAHAKTTESKSDSVWRYRHLVLGAVGIFVYVGAEVSIGSFLVSYMGQPYIANLVPSVASGYLSFYWGGLMVGRFAGSWLLTRFKPGLILGFAAFMCCLLVTTSILTTGPVAMWSMLSVGLFESIMFPTIFTLGIARLGPMTAEGSGLLIAAIFGGAVVPECQGILADKIGIHTAFVLPIICFLYIAFYGFRGSKPSESAA